MKFITREKTRFSNEFFFKYPALGNKILWDICYITFN